MDISSKFCTITIFIIVNLYTIFCIEFVEMVMMCIHTKFHIPDSNGSLVTAIKLKYKYRFHAAILLLFYIL